MASKPLPERDSNLGRVSPGKRIFSVVVVLALSGALLWAISSVLMKDEPDELVLPEEEDGTSLTKPTSGFSDEVDRQLADIITTFPETIGLLEADLERVEQERERDRREFTALLAEERRARERTTRELIAQMTELTRRSTEYLNRLQGDNVENRRPAGTEVEDLLLGDNSGIMLNGEGEIVQAAETNGTVSQEPSPRRQEYFLDLSGGHEYTPEDLRAAQVEPEPVQEDPEPTEIQIRIPGYTFVPGITRNMVYCPINSGLSGVTGQGPALRHFVGIPMTGELRADNGHTYDLGDAVVGGYCAGSRTDKRKVGRAHVELDHISFTPPGGETQFIKVSGVIADAETSALEIEGPIQTVQAGALRNQLLATGFAVAGRAFSSTGYELTEENNQVFTGNPIHEVAVQGASGASEAMANAYKSIAESQVDTVVLKSGIPVRIQFNAPFTVTKPVEPGDQYRASDDIYM